MLAQISIRNLAVIEQANIEFGSGLQVLTGETGAGKSIVIDAFGLVAGARGSAELVRHGAAKAEIEAMFELPDDHQVWRVLDELGIPADPSEPLLIRRELGAEGKSAIRVNGRMVTLAMLREIGDLLVNLNSQHEHQSLLKTDRHLEWLDQYAQSEIGPLKRQYQNTYAAYASARRELADLQQSVRQTLQMADLYRFQAEEIGSAKLVPGEDEALEQEKLRLSGGEKLMEAVSAVYEALNGGGQALEKIAGAVSRLSSVSRHDPARLEALVEQIQSAYYQLEDAAHELRAYRDGLEFDPARLDQVESRLAQIQSLKRKYGATIADILALHEKIRSDLETLETQDERIDELEKRVAALREALAEEAGALGKARRKAADRLAADIERHLKDLHMERTRFVVKFEQVECGKDGADKVEFLISANPGEPPRPLAKIASGGELSRIMLALKSIFAAIDRIPVLVFDEVDTGVSGQAAQAISRKLADLAATCQVFSVTHLPQVASMADAHYLIYKEVAGDRTFTKVEALKDDARVHELARMLGGVEITETTIRHAREMIELARKSQSNSAGF
jgi:DNA repair protein RecN (Recombination protein N)